MILALIIPLMFLSYCMMMPYKKTKIEFATTPYVLKSFKKQYSVC